MLACGAALALVVADHGGKSRLRPSEASMFPVVPAPMERERERQPVTDSALMQAEETRYRALSEFVAKRYRVSQDAAFDLVTVAHQAAHQLQLDPLLIIAVIAIESRFNRSRRAARVPRG
jgi:hypothetical protein